MKHITTLLAACFFTLAALATEGVNFTKNMTWAEIKAKAAREKKMIFFDAYTTWCGPCKYLEQSVYTDGAVAAYYNANFINVKFDMEAGEGERLAEEFDITSYPTLLFFSPSGKLVHKAVGAMEAPDFIALGKDARDPTKQYYTLKQKVVDHKATTADFVKWSELANDLEDNNRGTVASTWLSGQADILGNADLAKATLLYTDVSEAQLSYLYKEQKKIQQLLGWDAEKTTQVLYRKLFHLALTDFDTDTRNTDAFSALFRKMDAAKLNYALKDLGLLLALNIDKDSKKAMEILAGSIIGSDRVSLEEMASLLIDYSPRFEKSDMEILKSALDGYTLSSIDKGGECWLYLAQVITYSKLEDMEKAKVAADKAYRHESLPTSYKSILKESYGLSE